MFLKFPGLNGRCSPAPRCACVCCHVTFGPPGVGSTRSARVVFLGVLTALPLAFGAASPLVRCGVVILWSYCGARWVGRVGAGVYWRVLVGVSKRRDGEGQRGEARRGGLGFLGGLSQAAACGRQSSSGRLAMADGRRVDSDSFCFSCA